MNSTNVFYVIFIVMIAGTLAFIGYLPLITDRIDSEGLPEIDVTNLTWIIEKDKMTLPDCHPNCEDKTTLTFGLDDFQLNLGEGFSVISVEELAKLLPELSSEEIQSLYNYIRSFNATVLGEELREFALEFNATKLGIELREKALKVMLDEFNFNFEGLTLVQMDIAEKRFVICAENDGVFRYENLGSGIFRTACELLE